MTASDVKRCSTGSITVCPANKAIFDIQPVTSESKLYFQTADKDGPCRRSFIFRYEAPTLLRHGDVWHIIFRVGDNRLRFPRDNTWKTRDQILSGAGLIPNATKCGSQQARFESYPSSTGQRVPTITPSLYTPEGHVCSQESAC
jgi:hypothetical protein